jgi:hypothetical protein
MPATLCQSSLQGYVDCPRRFDLRYVQRLSYPAMESEPALENEKHQQEGEYFHRLAQQHLGKVLFLIPEPCLFFC